MTKSLDINKLHLGKPVQELIAQTYQRVQKDPGLFIGTPHDTSVKDQKIRESGALAGRLGIREVKMAILGGCRTLENGLSIQEGSSSGLKISCIANFESDEKIYKRLEWIEARRCKKMPFPVFHLQGEILRELPLNYENCFNFFFIDRCGAINGYEDILRIVNAVKVSGLKDSAIVLHLTAAMRGLGRSYQDYQTTWGPKLNARLKQDFKLLDGEGKFEKYKNPGKAHTMLSYQVGLRRL